MKKKDRLTAGRIFRSFWKSSNKLEFLINDIWVLAGTNTRKSWEAESVLTILPLVELFFKEKMTRQAADLTYSTIMSIVPILAIIFAVAKGFGMEDMLWVQIESLIGAGDIMDQVLMSVSKSVEMTKASSGWIFGVALLTLLYTANNALIKLEDIFNEIWNVEGNRGWLQRLPANMFFLLILPVVILMVGAVTSHAESAIRPFVSFADWMIRCVVVCIVLSFVYKALPETNVKWRGAIVSGVIAGVCLTIWHFGYTVFQNSLFNYNKVYGSFAAIPFFLIWTLISWIICLIGAKFNMVFQMSVLIKGWTLYDQDKVTQMSLRDKMQIILTVASASAREFLNRKEVTLNKLVAQTEISHTYVVYALRILSKCGFMHYIEDTVRHVSVYYPSVPVESLTVGELIMIVYTSGATDAVNRTGKSSAYVDEILSGVVKDSSMLLKDLDV